jgi:hypothetical protein
VYYSPRQPFGPANISRFDVSRLDGSIPGRKKRPHVGHFHLRQKREIGSKIKRRKIDSEGYLYCHRQRKGKWKEKSSHRGKVRKKNI